ncbi:MAG: hypothetical protein K2R98_15020 [Gemmataceae bacterium]|nr:hypothetical protein [Gemmataceae bacterium]
MKPSPPLLVFADDWGRHPSSAQHLIRNLLDAHAVCWVNTIGTRTPSLDWSTVRRGVEKVRHWARGNSAVNSSSAGPKIVSPRMWPWFSSRRDRWLNRMLLEKQLRPLIASLDEAPIAITTLPIVADLMGPLPVARWVYYCVDDFTQWPGLDGDALRHMEDQLVARADDLIAVSETLRQRLARMGRDAHLLTHGVDLDFWKSAPTSARLPDLQGLPQPWIVFWGVIDRRMDVEFVQRLAGDLTHGTVILIGPQDRPDPALHRLPRVAVRPSLPFEALPGLARQTDVLIMPYADLPVTRAMQPLKLKEYLATGKPAVARDLPANRSWSDCLDLTTNPEDFSRLVRLRLAQGLPEEQRRARQRLQTESWAAKSRQFQQWIAEPGNSSDFQNAEREEHRTPALFCSSGLRSNDEGLSDKSGFAL